MGFWLDWIPAFAGMTDVEELMIIVGTTFLEFRDSKTIKLSTCHQISSLEIGCCD